MLKCANASRGFRAADGIIVDPTLEPIVVWNYETGLKFDGTVAGTALPVSATATVLGNHRTSQSRRRDPDERAGDSGRHHAREKDADARSDGHQREAGSRHDEAENDEASRTHPRRGETDEEHPDEIGREIRRAEPAGERVRVQEIGLDGRKHERIGKTAEPLGHTDGEHDEREDELRRYCERRVAGCTGSPARFVARALSALGARAVSTIAGDDRRRATVAALSRSLEHTAT